MVETFTSRRRKQAGYTLLLVMFMVAAMLIAAAAITPNLLTQGRREKEQEMVWRGNQYVRAIGLYYKKFGKYPTKVEDLTRQTNGVRFLRQAYKDPMNKEDGSWRFIYVGPNGQLIGSLKQVSLLQSTLSIPGSRVSGGGGLQPLSSPGMTLSQQGGPQAGAGGPGQQTNSATAANPLESQPQPFEGAVLGGNIIGVGSKVKQPSFRVYAGGDTYQQWEFIWNPIGQVAVPGPPPANPNANSTTPNATGANPPATTPNGSSTNPPDGQQPQQIQQPPTVNVPPPSQ